MRHCPGGLEAPSCCDGGGLRLLGTELRAVETSPAAIHVGFGPDGDAPRACVTDGAEDVLAALDPGDVLGHELTEEDDALVDEPEVPSGQLCRRS
jgi:hypothetical protein